MKTKHLLELPFRHEFNELNSDNQGIALFWMIREIAKGISWLDGMYLDFAEYYRAAYH